jgi:hypothetical protein
MAWKISDALWSHKPHPLVSASAKQVAFGRRAWLCSASSAGPEAVGAGAEAAAASRAARSALRASRRIKDHQHSPLLQTGKENVIEKVFGEYRRKNQAGVEGRSVAPSLSCLAKPAGEWIVTPSSFFP